jgi:hypothetical protein
MTAIAIWCNHENAENPGLWVAADTRVSTPSGSLIDELQRSLLCQLFADRQVQMASPKNAIMTILMVTVLRGTRSWAKMLT